jgi:uncharacterized protein HemY
MNKAIVAVVIVVTVVFLFWSVEKIGDVAEVMSEYYNE